jgi:methyl-accepting chemotaxis protein
VVASEVRSLAQRSAAAAKEIKGLIVASVGELGGLIEEIASASQEQAAGIEQVNQSIVQMDGVTQQNAALVEEASAAARALNAQSAELQQSVGRFRLADAQPVRKERVAA